MWLAFIISNAKSVTDYHKKTGLIVTQKCRFTLLNTDKENKFNGNNDKNVFLCKEILIKKNIPYLWPSAYSFKMNVFDSFPLLSFLSFLETIYDFLNRLM